MTIRRVTSPAAPEPGEIDLREQVGELFQLPDVDLDDLSNAGLVAAMVRDNIRFTVSLFMRFLPGVKREALHGGILLHGSGVGKYPLGNKLP